MVSKNLIRKLRYIIAIGFSGIGFGLMVIGNPVAIGNILIGSVLMLSSVLIVPDA